MAASLGAHAGACEVNQLLKTAALLCRKLFVIPGALAQAEGSVSVQLIELTQRDLASHRRGAV